MICLSRALLKNEGKFEADSYEASESTYLGMEITTVNDGEFAGIALDSGNYEGEINHFEIPHERTRAPKDPLAEDERTIFRSEPGKLMRIARTARPGAIYDAPAAAQTFSDVGILGVLEQVAGILENGEKEVSPNEKKEDFEHMPGFAKFMMGRQKDVNIANLLKGSKIGSSKTHFTVQNLIF